MQITALGFVNRRGIIIKKNSLCSFLAYGITEAGVGNFMAPGLFNFLRSISIPFLREVDTEHKIIWPSLIQLCNVDFLQIQPIEFCN